MRGDGDAGERGGGRRRRAKGLPSLGTTSRGEENRPGIKGRAWRYVGIKERDWRRKRGEVRGGKSRGSW